MNTVIHCCTALLAVGVCFVLSQLSIHAGSSSVSASDSVRKHLLLRNIANHLDFARICDTVYVVGNRFIEVNLATQHATLRYRNGDSLTIPISTGRVTNDGGIITPSGIFSIQSKTREAISRQFDNTKMLWWIGFNYNVGFHGLEKDSYYRHLGVRPSSHGCVRTGREDVAELFKRVEEGDPVIVFDTPAARILAFADTTHFDTTKALALGSRTKITGKIMEERLRLLYTGERLARQNFSVFIPLSKQLRPGGYAVGARDSLSSPQIHPVTIAGKPLTGTCDYFQSSPAALMNRADLRQPTKSVSTDSVPTQDTLLLPKKKKIVRKRSS